MIERRARRNIFYAVTPERFVGAAGQPRVAAAEMRGEGGEFLAEVDFAAAD